MNVFPNRLPLAKIADHMVDQGFDEETTKTLDGFLESFVGF